VNEATPASPPISDPIPSTAKVSRAVVVRCPRCGTPRAISERQARRESVCRTCFFGKEEDASRYRQFWTSRFTMTEIRLMGAACFGSRREFAEALTASGSQDWEWE
jgi:ribosomal protein L37E